MKRKERKLEKARAGALSSMSRDRVRLELMAQRPRTEDDKLNTALLQTVLDRFTELEAKDNTIASQVLHWTGQGKRLLRNLPIVRQGPC